MYLIKHLPTRTYYGVQERHMNNICVFKKRGDAQHIADSLSTYISKNKSPPILSNKLCLMKKDEISKNGMDNLLWVDERKIDSEFIKRLGLRGLHLYLIKNIELGNENEYKIEHTLLDIETNNIDVRRIGLEIDFENIFQ